MDPYESPFPCSFILASSCKAATANDLKPTPLQHPTSNPSKSHPSPLDLNPHPNQTSLANLPRSRQASFSGLTAMTSNGEVGSALYAAGIQGWARGPPPSGSSPFTESRSGYKHTSQTQLAPIGTDLSQGASGFNRARPSTTPTQSPW